MGRARGWTCQRQSKGCKCGQWNPPRTRKCTGCGKPRRRKSRPAHLVALDLDYQAYIEINGGEFCGICGAPPLPNRKLDRDHDHATKQPRGLLCRKHNRLLTRYHTPEFMRAALAYIERGENR